MGAERDEHADADVADSAKRKPTCHPDRPHKAKGMCASCYVAFRERERRKTSPPTEEEKRDASAKLNLANPKTVDVVAEALVSNTLDAKAAIKQLKPEISERRAAALADKVQASAAVTDAVQKKLIERGIRLGEDAKKDFVDLMWAWLQMAKDAMEPIYDDKGNRDYKLETRRLEVTQQYALKAAQILGKGFIGEKVTVDKPEPLMVEGIAGIMASWERQGQDEKSPKQIALTAPQPSTKEEYDA